MQWIIALLFVHRLGLILFKSNWRLWECSCAALYKQVDMIAVACEQLLAVFPFCVLLCSYCERKEKECGYKLAGLHYPLLG